MLHIAYAQLRTQTEPTSYLYRDDARAFLAQSFRVFSLDFITKTNSVCEFIRVLSGARYLLRLAKFAGKPPTGTRNCINMIL